MIVTHPCPIEGCPFEVPHAQLMCKGHWRLVPKPIAHDVYATFRKRRGGPTHLAAMTRAIASVTDTMAGWCAKNAAAGADTPARLPYRDT